MSNGSGISRTFLQPEESVAEHASTVGEEHRWHGETEKGASEGQRQGSRQKTRGGQVTQNALCHYRPGWFGHFGEVVVRGHGKPAILSKDTVVQQRPKGWQGSFQTEVAKKDGFKRGRVRDSAPAGQGCSPSGDKDPVQFLEKGRTVLHMAKGFDGDCRIETMVGEMVLEPVAVLDLYRASCRGGVLAGPCGLAMRDGDTGDRGSTLFCDLDGVCSVATANIDKAAVRCGLKRREEEREEPLCASLHVTAVSFLPEAMVEGFAPDGAVEPVELVILGADIPGGDGFGGWEHVQGVMGGYGSTSWTWGSLLKRRRALIRLTGIPGGGRGFRGSSSVEGGGVHLQRLTRNLYPSGCS